MLCKKKPFSPGSEKGLKPPVKNIQSHFLSRFRSRIISIDMMKLLVIIINYRRKSNSYFLTSK